MGLYKICIADGYFPEISIIPYFFSKLGILIYLQLFWGRQAALNHIVESSLWVVANPYLLTLPLFAGVSRVRALSPAWTGSHARETLISRTHLFLPHDIPPTKKSSKIKSWPTFCDQYFWKFPIWNSCADEKRREIRMVKMFKWYPVIDLFDTFTGKLGHGD